MNFLIAITAFLIIALASKQIGGWFSMIRLPYITGYLFAGVLVGPFMLDLIQEDAAHDLHFIEQISVAVIAFIAGSELYLKELKGRFRSIAISTSVLIVVVGIISSISVFFLTSYIPFTKDGSTSFRLAVAILTATILISLSPAAAVAVVKELRAKGPFTKTVLGIIVMIDVVIITLFAFSTLIAQVLLTDSGFSPTFLGLSIINLIANGILGLLTGYVLVVVLGTKLRKELKIALILLVGYGIFVIADQLHIWSHDNFLFEITIEPLLPAVIASFYITNYSPYRLQFGEILEDVGPAIYVAFFTVTGITLNVDVLIQTWWVALCLFAIRIVGIFLGAFSGATLAGESPKTRSILWMAFISQAGISLGLARETAVKFPELGAEFATMLVSVVVLNEVFGPVFMRQAIKISGEARIPEAGSVDAVRHALILGVEPQSLALARQLRSNHWKVTLADTVSPEELDGLDDNIPFHYAPEITEETMEGLMTNATDAVVAMLRKDSENFKAITITKDKFAKPRAIVRLNDPTWTTKFYDLGAMVVNPTEAMVALLDQFVRAPQSAALFLHHNPNQKIAQITITDKDYHNVLLRDLRLPSEVIILGINRDSQSIVPHGHTKLNLYDEVTLLGDPEVLEEVTLRLGY